MDTARDLQSREARHALRDFEQAQALQTQGDIAGAARAYRLVGPGLPELLAQTGLDGRPLQAPDFLVIGAARAGTTWLKKRLARHPEIFVLAGEGQYFSFTPYHAARDYLRSYTSGGARLLITGKRKQLALADPAAHKLFGEKSPSYLSLPDAYIDLCAALFPKVKLICNLREPVSRAWSHVRMRNLQGLIEPLVGARMTGQLSALDHIINQGRYLEHLKLWARHFPAEQVLLLDFDRFAKEPEAVYRDVLDHIGATPAPIDAQAREGDPGGRNEEPVPPALLACLADAYRDEAYDAASLKRAMYA